MFAIVVEYQGHHMASVGGERVPPSTQGSGSVLIDFSFNLREGFGDFHTVFDFCFGEGVVEGIFRSQAGLFAFEDVRGIYELVGFLDLNFVQHSQMLRQSVDLSSQALSEFQECLGFPISNVFVDVCQFIV